MKIKISAEEGEMAMDVGRPEGLPKQNPQEGKEVSRGKLKIFLGYAAGVGKTFAMLETAHAAKKAGVDVVAGYIEPHTYPETTALLEGLEQLPILEVGQEGGAFYEFDLDAALARRPQLLLVDGLAHANRGKSRHVKRYQDVEELLQAGISVFTTVNVQQLESLTDIVAAMTQITIRERIPDSIFDGADQVELIDIEPETLIDRFNQGKIFQRTLPGQEREHFFAREQLVALRELALRRTADRVNQILEDNHRAKDVKGFHAEEHILLCISRSPSNVKVIRSAARMANAFRASLTALYVETPDRKKLDRDKGVQLRENLKIAESLGAKIATVYGEDVPYQISEYAKASGISKIVIGRSSNQRKFFRPSASFVERLTSLAPNLDIYIIPDSPGPHQKRRGRSRSLPKLYAMDGMKALMILASATCIGMWFTQLGFNEANIITIFLLGVLLTSVLTRGRLTSAIFSLASIMVFNYFFTMPRFTLQADGAEYPVTFLIMLIASLLTSSLTTRVKNQASQAARKAYRMEVLLETSQKLQRAGSMEEIIAETAEQLIKLMDRSLIIYPAGKGELQEPKFYPKSEGGNERDFSAYLSKEEQDAAAWVYKNKKQAGATTDTLPGAKALYLAIRGDTEVFAVVGIIVDGEAEIDISDKGLLITTLNEIALAMEKQHLYETKKQISMEADREKLRANLLRAISHDLRTPLTSISGNASMLMTKGGSLNEETKQRFYENIYDDSMWLINLVENLLSVTRIDNGTMNINLQAELLDEVIYEALNHISRKGQEHRISVNLEDDLLMARMDSRLIIQVIINIVDNAVKYTPPGSQITLSARRQERWVIVEIADNGKGIPQEDREKLFEMFFTSQNGISDSRRGLGLGLSLCKSIILAHGGEIFVKENKPQGTIFSFTLQLEEIKA